MIQQAKAVVQSFGGDRLIGEMRECLETNLRIMSPLGGRGSTLNCENNPEFER